MKKRILSIALSLSLLGTTCSFGATSQISVTPNEATTCLNGVPRYYNNFNYNGSLYIPLRSLFEDAGYKVTWDQTTKTANIASTESTKRALLKDSTDIMAYTFLLQNMVSNYSSTNKDDITKLKKIITVRYNLLREPDASVLALDESLSAYYNDVKYKYLDIIAIVTVLEQAKEKSIRTLNNAALSEINSRLSNVIYTLKEDSDIYFNYVNDLAE